MNFKECAVEAGTTKAFTLQYVCWLVSRFALEFLEVCLIFLSAAVCFLSPCLCFPPCSVFFCPELKGSAALELNRLCIIHC